MDPDIPVAYGTPVFDAPTAPFNPNHSQQQQQSQRPNLQQAQQVMGRSSRVMLPQRNNSTQADLTPDQLRTLLDQGYTVGLAQALHDNAMAFSLRIWIVDNSGSMIRTDGHRIAATTKNNVKLVPCTRWAELQQTVEYHAQMAALLRQPTVFRLLNDPGRHVGPQQFSIAAGGNNNGSMYSNIDHELAVAQSTMMNASPSGVTPLADHLRAIRQNIVELTPQLRRDGTKVALILATDGLPTNNDGFTTPAVKNDFIEALRALKDLPVWIVVRLCTDEEEVVAFWNDLDSQLEISLEVLDDFTAEAFEVQDNNAWVNYGLPMHRMREMGFHDRLFDMLDERPLSRDELTHYCRIVLGREAMHQAPDPQADWNGFVAHVQDHISKAGRVWNPATRRMAPWIDMGRLKRDFNTGLVASFTRKCCRRWGSSSSTSSKKAKLN